VSATGGPTKATFDFCASEGSESISGKIKKRKRSASTAGLTKGDTISFPSNLKTKLEGNDPERVQAWHLLLVTRPQADEDNNQLLSAWLMRVMAVSDMTRPIGEVLSNIELIPPCEQDVKPAAVPMTHSDETEKDFHEDPNDSSGSGDKPAESCSSSSSIGNDEPPSSCTDSYNMDSNDSNDSSSDSGLCEENDISTNKTLE
jgi:hypothetical protein